MCESHVAVQSFLSQLCCGGSDTVVGFQSGRQLVSHTATQTVCSIGPFTFHNVFELDTCLLHSCLYWKMIISGKSACTAINSSM